MDPAVLQTPDAVITAVDKQFISKQDDYNFRRELGALTPRSGPRVTINGSVVNNSDKSLQTCASLYCSQSRFGWPLGQTSRRGPELTSSWSVGQWKRSGSLSYVGV